jgi:c(7)-type cytochrome triheme protein
MNGFNRLGLLSKASLLIAIVFFVGYSTSYMTPAEAARKSRKSSKIDPNDPTSVIYLDTSGKLAGKGDPDKPASKSVAAGRGWHPQAMRDQRLPKDKYGLIDWVQLVKRKMIKPRPSLDPNFQEMPPLDMNVLIESKSNYVNDVIYPHWIHTYWLPCSVCHPKIFIPARGQNNMTMAGISRGKWCGRCHGKIAFPLTDCMRCHVSPKKKTVKKRK